MHPMAGTLLPAEEGEGEANGRNRERRVRASLVLSRAVADGAEANRR